MRRAFLISMASVRPRLGVLVIAPRAVPGRPFALALVTFGARRARSRVSPSRGPLPVPIAKTARVPAARPRATPRRAVRSMTTLIIVIALPLLALVEGRGGRARGSRRRGHGGAEEPRRAGRGVIALATTGPLGLALCSLGGLELLLDEGLVVGVDVANHGGEEALVGLAFGCIAVRPYRRAPEPGERARTNRHPRCRPCSPRRPIASGVPWRPGP